MTRKKENKIIEIPISEFSKKGNGIGFYPRENASPLKVEVPFTMPGDKVRASVQQKRAGNALGKLQEIIRPAPTRIQPKCIHFGICGGCRWQEIPYAEQLRYKEEIIQQQFKDVGAHIHPIIPCEKEWQYRNKMEFSFSEDAARNQYLGLIMDNGRGKVLNLAECHLVNPWFVATIEATRAWWQETKLEAYHLTKDTGSLRTLTVREGQRTGDRMVMLTVSGNPDFALKKQQLESFVAALRAAITPPDPQSHLSIFLRIHQIAKGMPTQFYEMHLFGPDHIREILYIQPQADVPPIPITFTISPSAFFQPNSGQAEKLYSRALQMAALEGQGVVYDLYCGTGTLGICISKYASQVIGVEISPESSLDARTNAKNNGITNYTVFTGPVHEVLHQKQLPAPDLILLDPPRAGLDPHAIREIVALGAPKIIYISCNPATQAENVAELAKQGYILKTLQPVDQFPQTIHIENIALLVKS